LTTSHQFFARRILALLLCPTALLTTVQAQGYAQQAPTELHRELAEAESFYTQHRLLEAESLLRHMLESSPRNFAANEMLGLVLVAGGSDDEATSFLEQAVRLGPASVAALENLATNYARLNKTAEAEKEFKAAVALAPHSFEAQHEIGEFYASRGNVAAAVASLKVAQTIKPADYNNGYDLALAEIEVGKLSDAGMQIDKLIHIKDVAELHSLLAEVYEKEGSFLRAAEEYQRAVRMNPTEDAIFDWATELLRHHNFKESAEVFARGTEHYPRSPRMFTGLGMTQSLMGNSETAVSAMLHALDLAPSDPKGYFFLSMLDSIPSTQAADVNARFEQYAAENPSVAKAQLYYANSLFRANPLSAPDSAQSKKVEALLQDAVRLDPTLADAHLQLGIIDARRDDYNASAVEFEDAIKYRPTLAVAHYRYAQTLLRLGQKERAQQEMDTFRHLKEAQTLPDSVKVFILNDPAN
jgi:tetratricopeptide (TPR) repeat protein